MKGGSQSFGSEGPAHPQGASQSQPVGQSDAAAQFVSDCSHWPLVHVNPSGPQSESVVHGR